ncbi:MAG: cytochrome C [Planctomycetota bacterium]|nr:cytochrome C [Planctomycetota bacterium]
MPARLLWTLVGVTAWLGLGYACSGDPSSPSSAPSAVVERQGCGRRIVDPAPTRVVDVDDPGAANNSCLTCHDGIEAIRNPDSGMFLAILDHAESAGHDNRCIVCHGGDADARATADMTRDSDEWRAVAARAHSGTPAYYADHKGPKDFYPDPGSPWINEHTCGMCHEWQVRTQWQSLMMTEAGKIQGTLWGFGGLSGYEHKYGNYDVTTLPVEERVGSDDHHAYMRELMEKEPQVFLEAMKELPKAPTPAQVEEDPRLAAFTYLRGECQRCHLAVGGAQRHGDYRGLGCSACHVPYANSGVHQGGDPTQGSTPGKPLVHSIQGGVGAPVTANGHTWTGIPVETCTTCHNRGRRIGVSYQGLMESPYPSPWAAGGGEQQKLHGKHYRKLHADLHADKGFLCQDCHTSIDVHSSGQLIGAITAAVEVECSDCHGTPTAYPWELPLGAMDEYEERPADGAPRGTDAELPDYLEASDHPAAGDGYLRTARGNPFGNVVRQGDKVHVHLASGAVHELIPLKGMVEQDLLSKKARVAMVDVGLHMDRMECYACHATWAPQCYGCHVKIDYSSSDNPMDWVAVGHDHLADGTTCEFTERADAHRIPGKISELRAYLRWEDPALAVNGEGRIAPAVPGCQTTATVLGEDGEPLVENRAFRIPNVEGAGPEGQIGVDHSPLQPHTTQREARSCESCHGNPKAAGYGIDGGKNDVDPSVDHFVDLMDGDGALLANDARPQVAKTDGLRGDWSRFVTEDGEQLQTVGHHLRLSRPLNERERALLEREGTCVACHQSLPEGDLAVSALHHVAQMLDALPVDADAHASLVHKIVRVAAWAQVVLGVLFVAGALWLLRAWRRVRRASSRARA